MQRRSKDELLDEYRNHSPTEVHEFTVMPDLDYGEVDWETSLITSTARQTLERSVALRVLIGKKVPKDFVISALKDIVGALEACDQLAEQVPDHFGTLSKWFKD